MAVHWRYPSLSLLVQKPQLVNSPNLSLTLHLLSCLYNYASVKIIIVKLSLIFGHTELPFAPPQGLDPRHLHSSRNLTYALGIRNAIHLNPIGDMHLPCLFLPLKLREYKWEVILLALFTSLKQQLYVTNGRFKKHPTDSNSDNPVSCLRPTTLVSLTTPYPYAV